MILIYINNWASLGNGIMGDSWVDFCDFGRQEAWEVIS